MDRRRLERAASRGDVAAQATLLRARVAEGLLVQERVELAAHLGDAVASAAVGGEWCPRCGLQAHEPDKGAVAVMELLKAAKFDVASGAAGSGLTCSASHSAWIRGLARFPFESQVRVALAAAREVVFLEDEKAARARGLVIEATSRDGRTDRMTVRHLNSKGLRRFMLEARPRQAVEALDAWLADDRDEGLVREVARLGLEDEWLEENAFVVAWTCLAAGARSIGDIPDSVAFDHLAVAIKRAGEGWLGAGLRDVVRAEVAPWALGAA